jgi:membrane-anchored mycosin MYCP
VINISEAVGPDDGPAAFTVPGTWVDVAPPGSGLRSLAVDGGTTGTDIDGTSFAAPWVAGLAALLRERFPKLTATQIVDRILATARRPTGTRSTLQLGRGVIDPIAALTTVPDVLTPETRPAASAAFPGTPTHPTPAPSDPLVPIAATAALAAYCAAAAGRARRHSSS